MAKKKKTASPAPQAAEEPTFEDRLQLLEQIVRDLEEGKLGLNESLKRYESGVTALRACHEMLQQAERRIEVLVNLDADGNARLTPFEEEEADSLETKQQQRSRRRSQPSPAPEDPAERDLF